MERLEAALQKARAARAEASRNAPATPAMLREPAPADAPLRLEGAIDVAEAPAPAATPAAAPAAPGSWSSLREITIKPRVARAGRLTALMGRDSSAPFDMLRSRCLHQMRESGWKRLAITSPTIACGKTTVTANLALSMARQLDLKILLIDLDLRRPTLHRLFGHKPANDFSEVLRGEVAFADHAVRFGSNLAICFNRAGTRNSAELLQSRRTPEVLAEIERVWAPDFVLFDTPPMTGNDDNLGFLQLVDCALLVAAAEETRITQIDSCEKELAGLTNVLGTVLNKCRYADPGAGYDYGYY